MNKLTTNRITRVAATLVVGALYWFTVSAPIQLY
jgi:hypothetical protein